MANNGNLLRGNPETQFKSGRDAVENGRKGGIASGKAKKEAREAKELIEIFLSMPLKKGKAADIDNIKNFMEMKGKNVTVKEAAVAKLIQKVLSGDLRAFEMMLSLVGERPAESVDVNMKLPVMFGGEDELEE